MDLELDDFGVGDFELWTEETIDIVTPFSKMNREDTEYLKLEIVELKQLLISLAEKYQLSEDRRKVAEKRNTILKVDNEKLQQLSNTILSQKLEAEMDNQRTLDKLKEFIDFKADFEKQAEFLKKIIGHLPIKRNVSTMTSILVTEKSQQCLVDVSDSVPKACEDDSNLQEDADSVVGACGDNLNINRKEDDPTVVKDDQLPETIVPLVADDTPRSDENVEIERMPQLVSKNSEPCCETNVVVCRMSDVSLARLRSCQDDETDETTDDSSSNGRPTKDDGRNTRTERTLNSEMRRYKSKLHRLQLEVIALKNLNQRKSSDLDQKNRQLVMKNEELSCAKKEMSGLKMKVNRILTEQRKRPVPNSRYIKQMSAYQNKPERNG